MERIVYNMDKLERLKNLEKIMDIDPIVLLEELIDPKKGKIYIRHNGEIVEIPICFVDVNFFTGGGLLGRGIPKFFFDLEEGWYFFEDYGNTWAWTREELENKKETLTKWEYALLK